MVKRLQHHHLCGVHLWSDLHDAGDVPPWFQRNLPIRGQLVCLNLRESFVVGRDKRLHFRFGWKFKMALGIGSFEIAWPIVRRKLPCLPERC